MSFRTLLLEHLEVLLKQDFDKVLFKLEGLYPRLPGQVDIAGSTQSQRAMQLIRFLEQDSAAGLCHLCQQLGEPFTVPGTALAKLEELLQWSGITEDKMRSVFGHYLKTLGEQALWNPPDLAAQPLWDELLSYLADPAWMRSSNKPHLLHFIQRLAPCANDSSRRAALQKWVGITAAGLDVPSPRAPRARSVRRRLAEVTQSYLLLAIAPQGNYFILHAWFMDAAGNCPKIYERKLGATLDGISDHLKAVFKEKTVKCDYREGNLPVVEFFLPIDLLLNHDPAQWKLPDEVKPLSTHCGLVLRSGERLWGVRSLSKWGFYWKRHRHTLTQRADERRTACLTCADGHYGDHFKAGRWVFSLSFVPDADCLELLLESGVGILLWPRRLVEETELNQLKTDMAKQKIGHLPLWLMEDRDRRWEATKTTGPFSLLWDDPQRSPDYYSPREPHADYVG